MDELERIALAAYRPVYGPDAVDVAGATCLRAPYAPDSPMLNRVVGLGVERPVAAAELDEALGAMVEARLSRSNGHLVATTGSHAITLDEETLATRHAIESYVGHDVILGVRPEDLEDAALAPDTPAHRRLTGTVRLRESLGSEVMVHLEVEAPPALTEDIRELAQDMASVSRPDPFLST